MKRILESESGLFYLDKEGMLTDFIPSETNPIKKERIEEPFAYYGYVVKKSIRHLIVPKGVKGFVDDFFRGIEVKEQFTLPEGLLYIGNYHGCVFAGCSLPEVRIPETVKVLGEFAFGHSHIGYLQIPSSIRSPYLRQFKDSCIETLCLPKIWKDHFCLNNNYLEKKSLPDDWLKFWGYLVFDAKIDHLIFE